MFLYFSTYEHHLCSTKVLGGKLITLFQIEHWIEIITFIFILVNLKTLFIILSFWCSMQVFHLLHILVGIHWLDVHLHIVTNVLILILNSRRLLLLLYTWEISSYHLDRIYLILNHLWHITWLMSFMIWWYFFIIQI